MYPKDDKRRLYQLIDMFLEKKITAYEFCNEFYLTYNLEIDYDSLSSIEYSIFSSLEKVSSRFSRFKEDIEKYPGIYSSEIELKEKIIQAKQDLEVS